jgi:hypothetical protein
MQAEKKLRDYHIRHVLLLELKDRFPDKTHDLILQEFGCNGARIDIAVVNGSLHGFEIKSDCDSLERLPAQIVEYSRIFDYVTLVSGKKLIEGAKCKIPSWWGVRIATRQGNSVHITEVREPQKNPHPDPASLAEMLWKSETIKFLRRLGYRSFSPNQPVDELRIEAARRFPVEVLAAEVRAAIKQRGGSGFEWLRTRNGGSNTTPSNFGDSHYRQNLDWLLSLK